MAHNHVLQSSREPVPGCPSCALIRPEVMRAHPGAIKSGMFGPPLREARP